MAILVAHNLEEAASSVRTTGSHRTASLSERTKENYSEAHPEAEQTSKTGIKIYPCSGPRIEMDQIIEQFMSYAVSKAAEQSAGN